MVDLSDPGKRLLYALEQRGFEMRGNQINREAAAIRLGVLAVTLRQHINRGQISRKHAIQYAKRLKVPRDWLLYGEGPNPFIQKDNTETEEPMPSSDYDSIANANNNEEDDMESFAREQLRAILDLVDLATARRLCVEVINERTMAEAAKVRQKNPPNGA